MIKKLFFLLLFTLSISCGPNISQEVSLIQNNSWKPKGMSKALWDDAHKAWTCAANKGQTNSTTYVVVDFSLPSDQKRLWVLDLKNSKVLYRERVAHGSKTGERYARHFSNKSESHKSSLGLYKATESYYGKHGYSRRLDGLEKSNKAARQRAIVIHPAKYVSDDWLERKGYIGRSHGCFAISPDVSSQVIHILKNEALLFAWHKNYDSEWSNCNI